MGLRAPLSRVRPRPSRHPHIMINAIQNLTNTRCILVSATPRTNAVSRSTAFVRTFAAATTNSPPTSTGDVRSCGLRRNRLRHLTQSTKPMAVESGCLGRCDSPGRRGGFLAWIQLASRIGITQARATTWSSLARSLISPIRCVSILRSQSTKRLQRRSTAIRGHPVW
jgi:hypothetical protein